MKNKKVLMIICVGVIGVIVFSSVKFIASTRPSQDTAQTSRLEDSGIDINDLDAYQDDTNDEMMYEGDYEVEEDFDEELYKIDIQGNVSAGVTFLNPIEEDDDYFNFGVGLNTHSVDLDGYDLSQKTILYVGDEIKITEGLQWTMVEGGGHHVSGMIKIPREQAGNKVNYIDKEYIRLEIRDLDGGESRVFEWQQELF